MQNGSMARKIKVLVDNAEIDGLVKFGEVSLEQGTIDVPSFNRIWKIQDGIIRMPEITLTYNTKRSTNTRRFLRDWYFQKQVKDMTIIACDATGTEFDRVLWSDVECMKLVEPEADLGSPTYAQISITVLPFDITPVA
jgi:hypothetical protein